MLTDTEKHVFIGFIFDQFQVPTSWLFKFFFTLIFCHFLLDMFLMIQIHRRPNERFCFSNGRYWRSFSRLQLCIILFACLVTHLWLFPSCSIGNFFFAGARIFFQSLDAAIFLFSRVSEIPCDSLVLPVISTNDRLTLGCELQVWSLISIWIPAASLWNPILVHKYRS